MDGTLKKQLSTNYKKRHSKGLVWHRAQQLASGDFFCGGGLNFSDLSHLKFLWETTHLLFGFPNQKNTRIPQR
jgi:hypothetical protein